MLPRFRSALVAGSTSMGVSAALRAFSAAASASASIKISSSSSSFQPSASVPTQSSANCGSFLVRSYTTSQPTNIRYQDIPTDAIAPPEKIDNIDELRTTLKKLSTTTKKDGASDLLHAAMQASKTPPFETIVEDLQYISEALAKENPTISRLFESIFVKPEEFKEGITKIERKLHPVSVTFLETLRATRKMKTLPLVIANFKNLVRESRNQVLATITSAVPLTDKQKQRLKVSLQSHVEAKRSVILEEIIDPTLRGGLQVRLGGNFVDLSIREPFQQTVQHLKNKSIFS